MKKIKYFYNTHTLRYEKLVTPLRVKLLRVFAFLATVAVSAALIVAIAFYYIQSPEEKLLRQRNEDLHEDLLLLNKQLQQLQQQMAELENRDNNVYRSIFEAKPIPDSARLKVIEQTKEVKLVQSMSEDALVKSITGQVNTLTMQVAYQQKSYDDISEMVKNKEQLLAAIPAIQPVSNKDLNRIA